MVGGGGTTSTESWGTLEDHAEVLGGAIFIANSTFKSLLLGMVAFVRSCELQLDRPYYQGEVISSLTTTFASTPLALLQPPHLSARVLFAVSYSR